MYFSKVSFQASSQAASELAKLSKNGVYSAHQLLWRLFPNSEVRDFLFREEIVVSGRPEFYVLSKEKPCPLVNLFTVQTKDFKPVLSVGQRLAFKLRVNPTVCITNSSGKSRRHDVLMHAKKNIKRSNKTEPELGLLMEQAAQQWLGDQKRLEQWGVELAVLPEVQRYTQHQSRKKNGHIIQFSSVDFEGLLTVNEPERFLQHYEKGFGRAKALGCGLMLIRTA